MKLILNDNDSTSSIIEAFKILINNLGFTIDSEIITQEQANYTIKDPKQNNKEVAFCKIYNEDSKLQVKNEFWQLIEDLGFTPFLLSRELAKSTFDIKPKTYKNICPTKDLWSIETIRWTPDKQKGRESVEYVVASNIEQVWKYLEFDRQDEGVEIRSIRQEVPVLKVLSDSE